MPTARAACSAQHELMLLVLATARLPLGYGPTACTVQDDRIPPHTEPFSSPASLVWSADGGGGQQQPHKPIKVQLGKGGLPPYLQPGGAASSGVATPATSTGGAHELRLGIAACW